MTMSNTDIGGFFATLGLLVDKPSFESGNKAVDAVTHKLTSLAGTVRNVVAIMGTYAVATGKVEAAELKSASALGISVEKLNQWKTAAKLAGVNANSLVSSMSQLENTFQRQKEGTIDEGLATKLGFLNLNYNEIGKLDAGGRLKAVLDAARAMKDQGMAAEIIGSIMGQAGLDFYEYLKLSNTTIDSILSKAGNINLTDESDYRKALAFDDQMNEMKARVEALNKLFGSNAAASFTPILERLNSWLESNGDDVVSAMTIIAEKLGIVAEWMGRQAGTVFDAAFNEHSGEEVATSNGVAGIVEKTKAIFGGEEAAGAYFDAAQERSELVKLIHEENVAKNGRFKSSLPFGMNAKISFEELSPALQARLKAFESRGGNIDFFRNGWQSNGELQDGIMRPDGTITHVAPDDWVFAARNISDLASAFIPQGMGNTYSSPTEFQISQTFNINGGNGLMPQTIRQQAYLGTQSAIQESMANSAKRMQLMPGAN